MLLALLFTLLVLAAARPRLAVTTPPPVVLVLDTGSNMNALRDDGTTDFDVARAIIRRHLRPGQRAAVVSAGPTPALEHGFSDIPGDLGRRLDTLRPGPDPSDPARAVGLARLLLDIETGGGPDGRVVLVTNGPAPPESASPHPVKVINVSTERPNAGIAGLVADRPPGDPATLSIFLHLVNNAPTPLDSVVEITRDGEPFDARPVTVPAWSETRETFETLGGKPTDAGPGTIAARLLAKDALADDNTAVTVPPPMTSRRILLVVRDNPFLEAALRADPRVSLEILSPENFRPALASSFDAVVRIIDHPQAEPSSRPPMPTEGNWLLFLRGGDDASPLARRTIQAVRPHAVTRGVRFSGYPLGVARAMAGAPPADWRTVSLVESFDGPLLLAATRGGDENPQRVLLAGIDPARTGMPTHPEFPIFLSNAVEWLAAPDNQTPRTAAPRPVARLDAGNITEARADSPRLLADFDPAPWRLLAMLALLLGVAEWILHRKGVTE